MNNLETSDGKYRFSLVEEELTFDDRPLGEDVLLEVSARGPGDSGTYTGVAYITADGLRDLLWRNGLLPRWEEPEPPAQMFVR